MDRPRWNGSWALWLFTTTFLLSEAVAASHLSDEAMDGIFQLTRGQQDKGENDYLESRLQKFVENEQNSKDYDPSELKSTDTPLAYEMDNKFASMEQYFEDGSENKDMAEMQQHSDESRTDKELNNIQQDNDDSMNKAELQRDEKDDDGKFDALLQQMERGGGGDNEKMYSLLQQNDDGKNENENKLQHIKDGSDDSEKIDGLLQQLEDGADKDGIEANASQDNEGEGTVNEDENAVVQWNNRLDGPLNVNCPAGYGISSAYSVFSSHHKDRLFRFGCRNIRRVRSYYNKRRYLAHGRTNCFRKKINDWDRPMHFACPHQHYLTGLYSYHSNHREDRLWFATCCRTPGVCRKRCHWTGWVNVWHKRMNFHTSGVFVGLYSIHNNHQQDRIWRILYCSTKSC